VLCFPPRPALISCDSYDEVPILRCQVRDNSSVQLWEAFKSYSDYRSRLPRIISSGLEEPLPLLDTMVYRHIQLDQPLCCDERMDVPNLDILSVCCHDLLRVSDSDCSWVTIVEHDHYKNIARELYQTFLTS
jgi:hypothetical protein